jgi:hypothetical protein
LSREEDDWEGALGKNLVFPLLLLAWVGAEGTGIDRGNAKEHGYKRGANQNSDQHSKLNLV